MGGVGRCGALFLIPGLWHAAPVGGLLCCFHLDEKLMHFRGERQCEHVAWRLAQPACLEQALPVELMEVVQVPPLGIGGPGTCSQDFSAWISGRSPLRSGPAAFAR